MRSRRLPRARYRYETDLTADKVSRFKAGSCTSEVSPLTPFGARSSHPPRPAVFDHNGVVVESYGSIGRMLDELSDMQWVQDVMLTFDFLIGIEQFGTRIQPRIRSRAIRRKPMDHA